MIQVSSTIYVSLVLLGGRICN